MKNLYLTASITLLTLGSAFGQKINVAEQNVAIGGGNNNALVVTIYEASPDDIEKEWKSKMKDFDAKVSSKDGGHFGDNAMIKSMGTNFIDIYSRAEKVKQGETKLIVAFDLGGAYLSSSQHGAQFQEAKKIVQEFAVKMTRESIADQVKAAQKVHEKLVDQHQDLIKDQKNLEEDIVEYKAKIKKAEEDIVKNKSEQEKKKAEAEAQKKVVDAIIQKEKAVN